ncbi:MAG TPA: hypothetical protein P5531_11175 [Bacteroidales bacterium]|nr:hypothetical protein [Bacteroidales bacterium]HSA44168.1 hypothetical protein [Bacteroidales bacterium]
MAFKLIFAAEVFDDLQQNIDWYNEKQPGLGKRFYKSVSENCFAFSLRFSMIEIFFRFINAGCTFSVNAAISASNASTHRSTIMQEGRNALFLLVAKYHCQTHGKEGKTAVEAGHTRRQRLLFRGEGCHPQGRSIAG